MFSKKKEAEEAALVKAEEAAEAAARDYAKKQGVDSRAIDFAKAAQKGEIDQDAVEGMASQKLSEMNPEVAGMVLGEDGKFDKDKALASGKGAAVNKFREENAELADAILNEDGDFDEEKAKAAARAAATKELKSRYGDGVAGEAMSLIGDDGLPDRDKMKEKAQGYFTKFTSLVTGNSQYQALSGQLIDDTNMEGLEEGNAEFQYHAEVTDPWLVDDDDDDVGNIDLNLHQRNISKAEKELTDVQFKHTMYDLSYHYYQEKNQEVFVTPSILITSISSFLSFAASAMPEHAQRMTLFVGFLGTVATILTALRSQYAWDTRAEAFRNASSEYHLICLKLKGKMRKDVVSVEAWEKTWKEIDLRKEELQQKIQVFPPASLVTKWQNQGKFASPESKRGNLMPPWTLPYKEQLRKDGVTTAEDFEFIDADDFDDWSANNKYPKIVIAKLMDTKQQMIEERANPTKSSGGIHLAGAQFKASTHEAFRRRGVTETKKLRFVNDKILDMIVDELISKETPPLSEYWGAIEEAVVLYRRYGENLYPVGRSLHKGGCVPIHLDTKAHDRISKIKEAEVKLDKTVKTPPKKRSRSLVTALKKSPNKTPEAVPEASSTNNDGPRNRLGKMKLPGKGGKKPPKNKTPS